MASPKADVVVSGTSLPLVGKKRRVPVLMWGEDRASPSAEGGAPQAGSLCWLSLQFSSQPSSLTNPGGTSSGCRSVLVFQNLLCVTCELREEAESCLLSALEKEGEEGNQKRPCGQHLEPERSEQVPSRPEFSFNSRVSRTRLCFQTGLI